MNNDEYLSMLRQFYANSWEVLAQDFYEMCPQVIADALAWAVTNPLCTALISALFVVEASRLFSSLNRTLSR